MSATENKPERKPQSVPQRPYPVAGVSMRDLLAAGVAASVISTPPSAAATEHLPTRPPVGGAGESKAA
jgi:hypothetical protein